MRKLILIISMFSLSAIAKTAPSLIQVTVPKTEMILPSREIHQSNRLFFFDLQLSSWAPQNLSEVSHLANTTKYSKSGGPTISLNIGEDIQRTDKFLIASRLGVSYLQLERSGSVGLANNSYASSEKLNIYQGDLGVEILSSKDLFKGMHPLVRLSLAPTWMQSSSSEFTNGLSEWSLPVRASAGLILNIPKVAQLFDLQDASFAMGFEYLQSFDDGNLNGSGLWAGTRIGWK